MITLLRENPLLLLFVIAAIGWPLGRIQIRGVRFGVAAVLFTGLAIGALDADLKLPEIVYQLGLVLFVYTVGLNSGAIFFSSLKKKGLRDNAFVLVMLVLAAGVTAWLASLFGFSAAQAAGLFAGSFTNTPALAGALDFISSNLASLPAAFLDEPVVAYSLTYPMGVLGMIAAILLAQRLWKVDYAKEDLEAADQTTVRLTNSTIRVSKLLAPSTLAELTHKHEWNVVFGRVYHAGALTLAANDSPIENGDLLTVVGPATELARVAGALGEISEQPLDMDRRELDYARVFVSNTDIAGHTLRSLNLPQHFGAIITRLRRGDIQLVPHGDTVLQMGDRVRVLTKRDHLEAVSKFLGDSYRAVSEVDVLTLGLGLTIGLLLGLLPIPLPGGLTLRLGLAGGPVIVALVLGALGRTGPFLWSLPYSTNLTLRQLGLVLFLAGVGSRAGFAFVATLSSGSGLQLFAAGAFLSLVVALLMLTIGRFMFKIPMGLLTGMLAGMQTQPALLSFAAEQSGDELPNLGYASVYPLATIAKIILAQLLVVWLL